MTHCYCQPPTNYGGIIAAMVFLVPIAIMFLVWCASVIKYMIKDLF